MLYAVDACHLEQVEGAGHIGFVIEPGLRQTRPNARPRSQVNDAVELTFIKDLFDSRVVANISLNKSIAVATQMPGDIRQLDIRRIEIVEVIDDSYLPCALRNEMVNEVRADETGTAGDQNGSSCHLRNVLLMQTRFQVTTAFSNIPTMALSKIRLGRITERCI